MCYREVIGEVTEKNKAREERPAGDRAREERPPPAANASHEDCV